MTTAQEIANNAKDANEAMNLAQAHEEFKRANQDWDNESTTFIFSDDSELFVQNTNFEAK